MKKIFHHLILFIGMILAYSVWTILSMIILSVTLYSLGYLFAETILNPGIVVIGVDIIVLIGSYYIFKSEKFRSALNELLTQIKRNK